MFAWVRSLLPAIGQAARNEEVKLTATFVNALAIAALVAGALGPYITSIPDADLPLELRFGLGAMAAVLHLAARLILRYVK